MLKQLLGVAILMFLASTGFAQEIDTTKLKFGNYETGSEVEPAEEPPLEEQDPKGLEESLPPWEQKIEKLELGSPAPIEKKTKFKIKKKKTRVIACPNFNEAYKKKGKTESKNERLGKIFRCTNHHPPHSGTIREIKRLKEAYQCEFD